MREIVGARIGNTITNRPDVIIQAVKANTVTEWLDRQRMKLMSSFDLGVNWDKMTNGPTLFLLNDADNPVSCNKETENEYAAQNFSH